MDSRIEHEEGCADGGVQFEVDRDFGDEEVKHGNEG